MQVSVVSPDLLDCEWHVAGLERLAGELDVLPPAAGVEVDGNAEQRHVPGETVCSVVVDEPDRVVRGAQYGLVGLHDG